MIFGSTSDPVLIKKINLRIWLLKDEIKIVTQKNYKKFDDKNKLKTMLSSEYSTNSNQSPNLKLIKNDDESAKKDDQSDLKDESKDQNQPEEKNLEETTLLQENQIIQRRSKDIPSDKIFNGVVVLSEIEMGKIHFFCNQKFLTGQTIIIEFQIPQTFSITCEVVYGHTFNMRNNIIGKNKYTFRIVAHHTFLKKGERTLLRDFIASIEPTIEKSEEKKKPEKMTNDSFDELDGLDL